MYAGEHYPLNNVSDYLVLGEEDAIAYKPDGSPLALLLKGVVPLDVCEQARPSLRMIGEQFSPKRKLHSGIFGNYDKPDCRKTDFNASDLEKYFEVLSFVRACSEIYRQHNRILQGRYVNQKLMASQTDPYWLMGGDTVFTTGTANLGDANHDARTKVHIDKGDLPEGFGVISILSSGDYKGHELLFPAYGLAVDMRTTDLLFCDVHEFHCNAPMVEEPAGWERIAVILYYITKMRSCPKATA